MKFKLTEEQERKVQETIRLMNHVSDDDLRAYMKGDDPSLAEVINEMMDDQLVERIANLEGVDLDPLPVDYVRLTSAAEAGLQASLALAPSLGVDDQRRLGRFLKGWHGFMAYAQFQIALKLNDIVRYSQPLPMGAMASQGLETKVVEPTEQLDLGSVGLVLVQDRLVRAKVFQRPGGFLIELELQGDPGARGEVVSDGEVVESNTTPTHGGIVLDFIVAPGQEYYIDLVEPADQDEAE